MHHGVGAIAASALLVVLTCPGAAQAPADLVNPQIDISYVQPANAALRPVYEHLRNRRVLETLQQFLAPLKLNRKLLVKFDQCGATALRYKPQGR
jgi:hypothetical protein